MIRDLNLLNKWLVVHLLTLVYRKKICLEQVDSCVGKKIWLEQNWILPSTDSYFCVQDLFIYFLFFEGKIYLY